MTHYFAINLSRLGRDLIGSHEGVGVVGVVRSRATTVARLVARSRSFQYQVRKSVYTHDFLHLGLQYEFSRNGLPTTLEECFLNPALWDLPRRFLYIVVVENIKTGVGMQTCIIGTLLLT
jgi:hypothetical protein